MNFPVDGRVVIIDDKFHEALPLIRILSQKRVATTFFSGRKEELPQVPFEDVRLAFIDIVLEGLDGADDKTKISTLVNVIKKIISKDNGPFILAIWTKHPEMATKIQKALKDEGYYTIVVNLEKDNFFRRREKDDVDEYSEYIFEEKELGGLEKKLKEQLNRVDIFKVLINWENLIHDAASKTINEVSRFTEYDDNWNDEIKKIFYNLAKAWAGKTIENMENTEKILSALYSFHQLFSDVFERELQRIKIEDIPLKEEDIEDDIVRGEINFRILMDNYRGEEIYPGNVYRKETPDVEFREFIKGILNENREEVLNLIVKNSIAIIVEVTPVCDFVQRKVKLHRLIKGVLIPDSVDGYTNIWKRIKKSASFTYVSPVIRYEEKDYKMILDFRYFTSLEPDELKDMEVLFRIRKELLSDIQINLSHHINRTGVLYLE